jgi:DNA-binding MarR family transcriptional regulator
LPQPLAVLATAGAAAILPARFEGDGVARTKKATIEATAAPALRPLPLWSRPGYLVRRLHQIHSAIFAEECKTFAITPVQYGVLTALLHNPGSDQASLGAQVGIDRTNAADVVERLAERGLVQREKSARDRRMMLARLTQEGEALTQDMHDSMQRAQRRLLEPLPAAERQVFLAMLERLVDANNEYGRSLLRAELGNGERPTKG